MLSGNQLPLHGPARDRYLATSTPPKLYPYLSRWIGDSNHFHQNPHGGRFMNEYFLCTSSHLIDSLFSESRYDLIVQLI